MSFPSQRERTDRLRAIPLTDVLRALHGQPDAHDPTKWHTERGPLSVNATRFYNWNQQRGGGGAIDLAMHLTGHPFAQALEWLEQHLSLPSLPNVVTRQPRPATHPKLPPPAQDNLPDIIHYLANQRRLPLPLLQNLCRSGDLYADRNRNAVFLLRNPCCEPVGAELRGTGPRTWRGMAPGTRKNSGHFAIAPAVAKAIVLCESAIDAISCNALYPERLCISTAGARDNPAWLASLLEHKRPIYCGFDADPPGERLAQSMIKRHPRIQRLRPPIHDWNDTLRART